MIKILIIFVLAACAMMSTAQTPNSYTPKNVNFNAQYFDTGVEGRYGVIVLSGSGGGRADNVAEKIASMGFNTLSLAYFDREGDESLPDTLELIPLEYFAQAKHWLMTQESTRNDGVIIYGLSKGAELALLLASYDEEYKAVVALAPSHVVWQGNPKNFADLMNSPSSWSRKGIGLPFVPYVSNEEKQRLGYTNRHEASLTNDEAVEQAKIHVENIKSPTLLLSGVKDKSWPATKMATEICLRKNETHKSSCTHIAYPEGDHLLSNFQDEAFKEIEVFLHALD